jgi:hypothetical protein
MEQLFWLIIWMYLGLKKVSFMSGKLRFSKGYNYLLMLIGNRGKIFFRFTAVTSGWISIALLRDVLWVYVTKPVFSFYIKILHVWRRIISSIENILQQGLF